MLETTELLKAQVEPTRRAEPRFQSIGHGELTVIDPTKPQTLAARIVDVSRSGLQVEVAVPIEAGSRIVLRLQSVNVFGKVGNCREHAAGFYRLGVVTSHVTSHV